MPLFACSKCKCVENTALSLYWVRDKGTSILCSECDDKIGKWHNRFEKLSSIGYWVGNDGFLYHDEQVKSGDLKWREDNQGFKILYQIKEE